MSGIKAKPVVAAVLMRDEDGLLYYVEPESESIRHLYECEREDVDTLLRLLGIDSKSCRDGGRLNPQAVRTLLQAKGFVT